MSPKDLKELSSFMEVMKGTKSKLESKRKEIFERFIKTGTLLDKDQKFCDSIDWYPVDWLPLREEFIKELKEADKEPSIKFKSVKEIFE